MTPGGKLAEVGLISLEPARVWGLPAHPDLCHNKAITHAPGVDALDVDAAGRGWLLSVPGRAAADVTSSATQREISYQVGDIDAMRERLPGNKKGSAREPVDLERWGEGSLKNSTSS